MISFVTMAEISTGVAVTLGVVVLALMAGIVWLLIDRSRQTAARLSMIGIQKEAEIRAAAATERLKEYETALREAQGRLEQVRAAHAELTATHAREMARAEGNLSSTRELLTQELDAQRESHRQALEAGQREHAAAMESQRRLTEEKMIAVERERTAIGEKLGEFDRRMQELKPAMESVFGSLASETLRKNTEAFLKFAEQTLSARQEQTAADLERRREAVDRLVQPIAETLKKTDERLSKMEIRSAEDQSKLVEQLRQTTQAGAELRSETAKLVRALREPQVRGRYGEIQLRRVAELAGMRSYCDFAEQDSQVDSDGNTKRPDMVVRLPNGRELVVDAKTNLKPYLDALEAATPDEAEAHLHRFADGLLKQAASLGKKNYYREYNGSPDFVVMFVPGDQFVDAALAKRPELLDYAAEQRVLLASPSSLIAMLRAVAVGFAEQRLTEEAKSIKELATELHERAAVMLEHLASVGKGLDSVVDRFNKLTGSVQSRLVPTLTKIEEKGVTSGKKLPEIETVAARPRLFAGDDGRSEQNGRGTGE